MQPLNSKIKILLPRIFDSFYHLRPPIYLCPLPLFVYYPVSFSMECNGLRLSSEHKPAMGNLIKERFMNTSIQSLQAKKNE
jgi:hypothetical protein